MSGCIYAGDMAFPVLDLCMTPNGTLQLGLTKREYFAAIAMQGLCASPTGNHKSFDNLAKEALEYADSLITELNK